MNSSRAWCSLLGPRPANVSIINGYGLNWFLSVADCRAGCSLDDQGRCLSLHRPAHQNHDQQHQNNQRNGLYKVFFAKLSLAGVAKLSTCPDVPTQSNDLSAARRTEIGSVDCEERHDCEDVPSTSIELDYNLLPIPLVTSMISSGPLAGSAGVLACSLIHTNAEIQELGLLPGRRGRLRSQQEVLLIGKATIGLNSASENEHTN